VLQAQTEGEHNSRKEGKKVSKKKRREKKGKKRSKIRKGRVNFIIMTWRLVAYHRAEVRAVTRNNAAAVATHGAETTAAVWCLWWAAGVGLLAASSNVLHTHPYGLMNVSLVQFNLSACGIASTTNLRAQQPPYCRMKAVCSSIYHACKNQWQRMPQGAKVRTRQEKKSTSECAP
jgi:hypothetical protein